MSQRPISRFPVPEIADAPDDIRCAHAGRAGEIGFRAERVSRARPAAGRVPRLLRLSRRPDGQARQSQQGRARDDRRGDERRQPVPILRRRARGDPAHPGQGSADRRPGRRQLPQSRHHRSAEGDAGLRHESGARGLQPSARPTSKPCGGTASTTRMPGTSPRSPRSSPCRIASPMSAICEPMPSSTCSAEPRSKGSQSESDDRP